jgi:hypothetical protein
VNEAIMVNYLENETSFFDSDNHLYAVEFLKANSGSDTPKSFPSFMELEGQFSCLHESATGLSLVPCQPFLHINYFEASSNVYAFPSGMRDQM